MEVPQFVNEQIAAAATAAGIPVFQDIGGEEREISSGHYANCLYISPNKSELKRLSRLPVDSDEEVIEAAKSLQAKGARNVLVTLGDEGCLLVTEHGDIVRQAGLKVSGEHRESTVMRASTAVSAVQGSLAKRLSNGMQFLASVASSGPFIGLFGTVYGIMNSFIGIANTNTTNLAVVAPGIAEALLATGIGLFAAIPSMIFYNYFQTRISAYGTRSEGFVVELLNAMSRQLDKGA
jgi:biopolymer transport protein ExbB/TolQ